MVAARLAASALEALTYRLWWWTRGARLPYPGFLLGLVALSLVDRFALSLTALAERTPAFAPWLAWLTGPRVLEGGWHAVEPGLASVFGSLGLLTLARVTMTAWLQATALGLRLAGPLVLTGTVWLATRVALWWALDLSRGMSPIG
jgi:hypothetical protein